MRITFLNTVRVEFNGNTINERPIGGTETAVINLARELAKKHDVNVLCFCDKPGVYDKVNYINVLDMENIECDVLVVLRDTHFTDKEIEQFNIKYKRKILWLHDFANSPIMFGMRDAYKRYDKVVALSEWHKADVMTFYKLYDDSKFEIIGNAINDKLFKKNVLKIKDKPRFIYSSTPFRGLDVLLKSFKIITKKIDAELNVYSSMQVYSSSDEPYKALYTRLKRTKGVNYIGSVKQPELAKAMQDSHVLTYPSTYPETYCITAIEAIASGTPVAATLLGALPEVLPESCSMFSLPNDAKSYASAVIYMVDNYTKFANAVKKAKVPTWKQRSKEWEAIL